LPSERSERSRPAAAEHGAFAPAPIRRGLILACRAAELRRNTVKTPRLFAAALAACLSAPASAVDIDWVSVGDPGNPADATGYGAVDEAYRIARTEVTNAQYVEFLNAVAAADPNGLYAEEMGEPSDTGGITRSGVAGSYTYVAVAGREQKPVNFVSFWDAARFANWLHNGQPVGPQGTATTEDGAYTLSAGGIVSNSITRNPGATIFLPSEDEWYKAAYHDAVSGTYFDYPTATDVQTACSAPTSAANHANCFDDVVIGDLTDVGAYPGSASPYDTFDQGGNLLEWNETIVTIVSSPHFRGVRGGSYTDIAINLAASNRLSATPALEVQKLGFRVASLPEPAAGALLLAGLLGAAGWRTRGLTTRATARSRSSRARRRRG
jgi:formylglycine-generating enzyme required for sulfatase activity